MNQKRLPFLALFLVLFLPFALFGCASGSTPARVAYNSIDGAVSGAQAAMSAFNERYQAGLQTEADRTKALTYYADFQATARLAATLAKDITQQQTALTIASDAAAKLIQLLAQVLPKKAALDVPAPLFWPQFVLVGGVL
jgi:hypothetical protein